MDLTLLFVNKVHNSDSGALFVPLPQESNVCELQLFLGLEEKTGFCGFASTNMLINGREVSSILSLLGWQQYEVEATGRT